ncbi:hypothetical protein ACLOJK_037196 [Asimina triloba]
MSFLSLDVFAGGKNLAKNFLAKSSQSMIDPAGRELSHPLALSLSVNGNRRRRMTSSDIPLNLNVSQISRKFKMWLFGSSFGSPLNWIAVWIICIVLGLIWVGLIWFFHGAYYLKFSLSYCKLPTEPSDRCSTEEIFLKEIRYFAAAAMDATARGGQENGPSGRNGAGSPPSLRLNCFRSHLSLALAHPPSSTQHPDLPASLLHTSNPLGPASLPNFSTDDNSLIDCLKGLRLQEFDVRHYPRVILKMKIADLKLIGKVGEAATPSACGGTPLYIGPECAAQGEYAPAANIWSLGCVVEEMAAGKPGKDFLEKCFVRDPEKRWTTKILLNHPFVAKEVVVALGGDSQRRQMIVIEKMTSLSPKSIFYFNSWIFIHSSLRSTVTLADSCRVLEGLRKFGATTRNRAASVNFIVGKRSKTSSAPPCGEAAGPKGSDSELISSQEMLMIITREGDGIWEINSNAGDLEMESSRSKQWQRQDDRLEGKGKATTKKKRGEAVATTRMQGREREQRLETAMREKEIHASQREKRPAESAMVRKR